MSTPEDDRNKMLTAFNDLSLAVHFAGERLRDAERRVERELLRRVAASDRAFICERCGAAVWVEIAEGEIPILVEADGRPHEDNCRPQPALFQSEEGK